MAKRPNPDQDRPPHGGHDDDYNPKRRGHGGGDGDGDDERAEQKIFGELVQRRLGGGATPTAEAYAKAMQQWQALPGAVQFVAVPRFEPSDTGASTPPDTPPEKPGDGSRR
jgi:hypothetical protein